jgi:hypothetical protein
MAVLDAPRRLARLRRGLAWHRRLGMVACGAIMLWSLSGAMHPLLSRYQPRPAGFMPPVVAALPAGAPSLAAVLATAGVAEVTHARLVQSAEGPQWQVEVPGADGLRYFAAADGREVIDGERRHAEFLARHYLGEKAAPVSDARRVTGFGGEYAWVNRLLPAWRIAFARDDGMRVYVEPRSAQLATLIDDRKALFNAIFVYGHTWRIPGLPEPLRLGLATLGLLAVTLTPLAGLAVWWWRRGLPAPGGLRRLHRRLGLTVALALLASATSGAWHLAKAALDRSAGRELPLRATPALPAATLDTARLGPRSGPVLSLRIVAHEGRAWARVVAPTGAGHGDRAHGDKAHGGHAGHGGGAAAGPPAVTFEPLDGGPAPPLDEPHYARALAVTLVPHCGRVGGAGGGAACVQAEPTDGSLVTRFGGEYGFVNKLLPVWRFVAGDTRLYVHPESDTLAARITPADYAEGWSFANLHKWQAFEFLGRWPRDLLQIAWALLSAATAAVGLRLLAKRGGARRVDS